MNLVCENCETELERVKDKLYCYTCEESYCIWCANDRTGSHGENCKWDIHYPF